MRKRKRKTSSFLRPFPPTRTPSSKGRPKRRHPRWSIQTARLTHRVLTRTLLTGWNFSLKRVHTGYEWRKSSTSRPTHDTDTRRYSIRILAKTKIPPPLPPHWRNNRGAWQRGAGEPPAESLPRKQRGQGRPLLNDGKYAVSSEVRCTRSTGALSWRLSRCRHGQRDLGCSLATPTRGSPNQHQLNRLPCLVPALPYRAAANLTAFPFHSTLSLSLSLSLSFPSPSLSLSLHIIRNAADYCPSRIPGAAATTTNVFPTFPPPPTINLAPNYSHHLAFCIPCHRWRSPLCVSSLAVLHGPRAPPRIGSVCMRCCVYVWSVARSVAWEGDARSFDAWVRWLVIIWIFLKWFRFFPRYHEYCKLFDGMLGFGEFGIRYSC